MFVELPFGRYEQMGDREGSYFGAPPGSKFYSDAISGISQQKRRLQ